MVSVVSCGERSGAEGHQSRSAAVQSQPGHSDADITDILNYVSVTSRPDLLQNFKQTLLKNCEFR